jgi:hypothetical protein
VDVRHREGRVDDPGQACDVLELLERAVRPDRFEQLLVREDPRRNAHVGAGARRDLPDDVADPPQCLGG